MEKLAISMPRKQWKEQRHQCQPLKLVTLGILLLRSQAMQHLQQHTGQCEWEQCETTNKIETNPEALISSKLWRGNPGSAKFDGGKSPRLQVVLPRYPREKNLSDLDHVWRYSNEQLWGSSVTTNTVWLFYHGTHHRCCDSALNSVFVISLLVLVLYMDPITQRIWNCQDKDQHFETKLLIK